MNPIDIAWSVLKEDYDTDDEYGWGPDFCSQCSRRLAGPKEKEVGICGNVEDPCPMQKWLDEERYNFLAANQRAKYPDIFKISLNKAPQMWWADDATPASVTAPEYRICKIPGCNATCPPGSDICSLHRELNKG